VHGVASRGATGHDDGSWCMAYSLHLSNSLSVNLSPSPILKQFLRATLSIGLVTCLAKGVEIFGV
jgi:hypothetical protein